MMCPDDGTIDHLDGGVSPAISKRFEHQVPKPAQRPASELAVHRVPIAKLLGQISPRRTGSRDPEHRIKRPAMVPRWAASQGTGLYDEGLKTLPFCVR
jgi:hypothetical protein